METETEQSNVQVNVQTKQNLNEKTKHILAYTVSVVFATQGMYYGVINYNPYVFAFGALFAVLAIVPARKLR